MRWYQKAADRKDTSSMRAIAQLYEDGQGVTQDYAEAMHWYRKAADLEDPLAAYLIAVHYLYAKGVPADEPKGREWMKKSAALGFYSANRWLIDNP
jgi:TPR repeat protein